MRRVIIVTFLTIASICSQQSYGQDKIIDILREEINYQMKELQKQEHPPYYLNFRVSDNHSTILKTSFGSIMNINEGHQRTFVPQIRIGTTEFDNFKYNDMSMPGNPVMTFPIDNDNIEDAARQSIWKATSLRYKYAVEAYKQAQVTSSVNTATLDKAPSFSKTEVNKHYEEPLANEKLKIDVELWKKNLMRISAVFDEFPMLVSGTAELSFSVVRNYFIDTDGTEVVQNLPYARIIVNCSTKADDGMNLPLLKSYFSHDINGLADVELMVSEAREMAETAIKLRNAPVVDPYTGPVLMSGEASGVFFHEIFGHRLEGQRMKQDQDGQTFKSKVGKKIITKNFNIYDDPSLINYHGRDLNGYYKYDDQGVKAQRVTVVDNGVLNEFLMTRTPIDGFPKSNGHARCSGGADPVSRQSNLIIESNENLSEEDMRNLFIQEIKAQDKEYGFYFKSVTSGFTYTTVGQINSFNVTPTEVYQVFADGREDRLIRGVDLIGTPLSMFSNITHGGSVGQVFEGMCGAESGWVPVTAISPSILCSKVEMQRKAKSNDLPPILDCPTKK